MRVLIIGTTRPGHVALKNLGCELVTFMEYKDSVPSDLSFGYNSLFYFAEDAPLTDYVNFAQVLHNSKPFDRVCSFNDNSLALVLKISKALNIHQSLTTRSLDLTLDKSKMRKELATFDLDNTHSSLIQSTDDAIKFTEAYGFPAIIKPINGTGSRGIIKINTKADIFNYFPENLENNTLIIEEFIDGKEFSVEVISEKGKHYLLAITEKYINNSNFIEQGHVVPANISTNDFNQISEYVLKVIAALGIKDGPTHTEVMLTKNGPVIIETHPRNGGDRINRLIKIAYDLDVNEVAARQIIGESITKLIGEVKPTNKTAAIWYSSPEFKSVVKLIKVDNQEKSRIMPGIHELHVQLDEGCLIGELKDSFSRAALAVAEGYSTEEALINAKNALNNLEFKVSPLVV